MPLPAALPLLLLAAAPVAALPRPITAEEALRRYRGKFKSVRELDCPRDRGDIVVCGRTGPDPDRAPMAYEPEEGQTVRLLPGEAPSARGAQNIDRMCMRDCEPAVGSIRNIVKGIGHLLGRDD
jgi:hypothetical protein